MDIMPHTGEVAVGMDCPSVCVDVLTAADTSMSVIPVKDECTMQAGCTMK